MKLFKIIDRYLLSETLPFAFIGFSFFTFLFILEELFRIFELILVRDVAFIKIVRLLAFLLPAFFGMTVPMGILIGVLLGITRLSFDTEMIAFQANGISVARIFRSIFIFGIISSIGMIIFNDQFIPYGNKQYKKIFYSIIREKPTISFQSRRLQKVGDYFIIPHAVHPQTGAMKSIYIYQNMKDKGRKLIVAKEGHWLKDKKKTLIKLQLKNGRLIEPIEKTSREQTHYKTVHTTFSQFILTIDTEQKNKSGSIGESSREKPMSQIYGEVKEIEKKYKDPKVYQKHYRWRDLMVELMKKFSIPLACFVFAFLGAPLGITSKRGGKGLGIGFSIIIIFIYYVLWYLGESLGKKNIIDVYTGGWLADIILLIAGVILNLRTLKQ